MALSLAFLPGRPSKAQFYTRRKLWFGAALLFGLVLVGLVALPLFRGIGSFLIVEDRLAPAAAIIVLAGHLPFREMEAAKLYRDGWAPQVIIVRSALSAEAEALQALKIRKPQEWEWSGEVLRQQGVPASAIVIPKGEGGGTLEEMQAAYKALASQRSEVSDQKSAGMPVILVTSKYHTRRTRLTWNYVTGGRSQPIVRAASGDPFDPEQWWHERSFVLSVVREYLGLINYYAGFPIGVGR